MRKILLMTLSIFLVLTTAHSAHAKKKKFIMKIGSVAPNGTPWSKLAKTVKKTIEKDAKKKITDTKVKVKVYLGGILGGEKSVLRRVKKGEIDIYGGSLGALATDVPEMGVIELPYLLKNFKEADFLLDKVLLKEFKKLMEAKGYHFMLWSENGYRSIGTKDVSGETVSKLKGLKLRAQEQKVYTDLYKTWGASPVPIAVPEVLSALQTGIVDGFCQTLIFTFATSWYTAITHYTLTNHIYQPGIIILSKKKYDTYPDALKKIALRDWTKLRKKSTKQIRRMNPLLLENLKKAGIKVIEPSPAELKEFSKDVKSVYKNFYNNTTPTGKKLFKLVEKNLKRKLL